MTMHSILGMSATTIGIWNRIFQCLRSFFSEAPWQCNVGGGFFGGAFFGGASHDVTGLAGIDALTFMVFFCNCFIEKLLYCFCEPGTQVLRGSGVQGLRGFMRKA
jgi:hypothetical protein